MPSLRRITRWLGAAMLVGVLCLALLLTLLWLEHDSSLELPHPTGPFAVGRVATTWVDTDRLDPFAPPPAQPRELVVWIWYPAQPSDSDTTDEYMPPSWRSALAEHAGVLLTQFLWRNRAKVHGHSVENADLAPDNATYPVVIFRSGIGALALEYATVVEDLASHGYIVVGADTPYSTSVVVMPDGRVIHKTDEGNPGDAPIAADEQDRLLQALIRVWTADARFLLDQVARLNAHDPSGKFTSKVDLDSVGVAGHSFGGATAAQFCHDDNRCRAGIDMDGALYGSVVAEGIGPPFLFLLSDHGDEWTSPDCEICRNIRSASGRVPGDNLIVTLLGAHHFSFGDQGLTLSRILGSVLAALGGPGGLEPRTALASTTRYVREFFDVHLLGAPREALYARPLVAGARLEMK